MNGAHSKWQGGGDSAAEALPRSTGHAKPRGSQERASRVLGDAQHKLSTKWKRAGRTQQAGRPIRSLCTPPKTISSPNSAGHLGSPQTTLPFRAAKVSPGGRWHYWEQSSAKPDYKGEEEAMQRLNAQQNHHLREVHAGDRPETIKYDLRPCLCACSSGAPSQAGSEPKPQLWWDTWATLAHTFTFLICTTGK